MSDYNLPEHGVIPWSYSQWNTFQTCPRQYKEKHVLKRIPFVQNEAAKWGDDVHKALEDNIRDGKPLPSNMVQYEKFVTGVKLRAERLNAERLEAEEQVALTYDLQKTSWFTKRNAPNPVWFRLKVDVTMIAGDYAEMYDWKTGKYKDDPDQLHLYAMVGFILNPQVQRIKVGYIWLKDGFVDQPREYRREDLPHMIQYWTENYEQIEEAWTYDHFPERPSGLCKGWCEVTDCPYWEPKRK